MFPTKHLIRKDITYLYFFTTIKKNEYIDKMESFNQVVFLHKKRR